MTDFVALNPPRGISPTLLWLTAEAYLQNPLIFIGSS
jgi:hypothetical protein